MVPRISYGMVWSHPPRKKLFLLVVLVVGLLTVLSITLLLESRDLEGTHQVPLYNPLIGRVTIPQQNATPSSPHTPSKV